MLTACREHIEIALDEFVDRYEEPPEMERVGETTFMVAEEAKCYFCGKPADFVLRRYEA